MKDGLTQVKELKDKIHEQYVEIQELNKARKFDIEYNKHLQKEIIRLNNIINELEKVIIEFKKQIEEERNNYLEIIGNFVDKIKELKGVDKE